MEMSSTSWPWSMSVCRARLGYVSLLLRHSFSVFLSVDKGRILVFLSFMEIWFRFLLEVSAWHILVISADSLLSSDQFVSYFPLPFCIRLWIYCVHCTITKFSIDIKGLMSSKSNIFIILWMYRCQSTHNRGTVDILNPHFLYPQSICIGGV